MHDLATLHKRIGPDRPLSDFYKTTAFRMAMEQLEADGVPPPQRIQKTGASRGNPAQCQVHGLLLIEYLRWAHYDRYSKLVMLLPLVLKD